MAQIYRITESRVYFGIVLCLSATLIFALQDAVTKLLTSKMPISQFVMIRYWFFLAFAIVIAWRSGRLRQGLVTQRPFVQVARSLLLLAEIFLFALGLRYLSLSDMHSLFVIYPVLATIFAVPILSERIGWQQIVAIVVSFSGALFILQPGAGIFGMEALIPLTCAAAFALYSLLTRLVSRHDGFATNVLYTALGGAIVSTIWGVSEWQALSDLEIFYTVVLSALGIAGQLSIIKALEFAPASTLQPFNYFTLVWAIIVGYLIFETLPTRETVLGSIVIVSSGLSMMLYEKMRTPS